MALLCSVGRRTPEDGGSYKPSTIEYFNNFEINDIVRFHWTYDHRPRINRFIEQEDDSFIPFYKGSPVLMQK